MNHRSLLLAGLVVLTSTSAFAANESWVRQTDLDSGLIYDIPLGSTGGSFTTPLPISDAGSRFELFARGTAWDTNVYLLDTKLIRAYAPTATMTLTTEDPYVRGDPTGGQYVRRTRADRPFNVQIDVSGLVPTSPNLAERAVYFSCQGRNYDGTSYSGLNQPQYLISESNLGNGSVTLNPLYEELNNGTSLTACGDQTYTLIRYAADNVPDTILLQPKLEVWPVATATLENIAAGQVFIDRIPTVVFHLKSLYPDSYTYVQVYKGSSVLGTTGTIITGSERKFGAYYNPDPMVEPTNVPQTIDISIDDLSNYAALDGIYTIEVITRTPFFNRAPERLLSVTFEVDRVISSRGQLGTAEKTSP